jgi:hypothetical protein
MKPIISALVLVAMGTACATPAASPTTAATSTATPAATVAAATTTPATTPVTGAPFTSQPVATGTITGVSGYPAEMHPAITIYAISTTDRSVYFSVDIPRSPSPPKPTYTISGVKPGTYNLFSYAEGADKAGGAYTEFVKCGLRATCSDHTPIDVIVRAGETVRGIEVSDWYTTSNNWPARPR